jgi:putative two-component system response regulator
MMPETPTLLVVDDNPVNLEVLFDLLGEKGFHILTAKSGALALKRAETAQPDLIVLDVLMPPGIDGFETCRRLKARQTTRDIPVIFMTALSDTVDKVTGFEVGAVDYITKPIQSEEVLARVNAHLTIQRLQKELRMKNVMLADRALHLEHLVNEQTRKIENLTFTLVNALENANLYNDTDTGTHIKRIGEYSACLAQLYGCDREFVKRIRLYAPLHDIGKVGLPDAILKKPGKYTPDEFQQMQAHVLIGARMLASEEIDEMARHIALYHHEKWDGSGYVHHLAGTAIPFEARIVTVVDVYDALISKRVYKAPFSKEEAERYIREASGTHFDPELAELFLAHKDTFWQIRHTTQ